MYFLLKWELLYDSLNFLCVLVFLQNVLKYFKYVWLILVFDLLFIFLDKIRNIYGNTTKNDAKYTTPF